MKEKERKGETNELMRCHSNFIYYNDYNMGIKITIFIFYELLFISFFEGASISMRV